MMNNLSIANINPADDFNIYQQTINAFPSLTAEEEYSLAMRLKKENDLEAAKQLILSHLKLVIKIARGHYLVNKRSGGMSLLRAHHQSNQ